MSTTKTFNHQYHFNYKVGYVYMGLIGMIIFGVSIFFLLHHLEIDFGVLEVIAYVTGTSATLTLFYHSLALENRIQSENYQNLLYQSSYTYGLISEWHHPNMMESISVTRKLIKDSTRQKELMDKNKVGDFAEFLEKNLDIRKHLILILNYFENIATMVKTDHVNKELIKKSFCSMYLSYYEHLENYIDYRQKEYADSWVNFEKLAKEWREEKKTA